MIALVLRRGADVSYRQCVRPSGHAALPAALTQISSAVVSRGAASAASSRPKRKLKGSSKGKAKSKPKRPEGPPAWASGDTRRQSSQPNTQQAQTKQAAHTDAAASSSSKSKRSKPRASPQKAAPRVSKILETIQAARAQVEEALEKVNKARAPARDSAASAGSKEALTSQAPALSDIESQWGPDRLLPPSLGSEDASARHSSSRTRPPHQQSPSSLAANAHGDGRPMKVLSRKETEAQRKVFPHLYIDEHLWETLDDASRPAHPGSTCIGGRLSADDVPYEPLNPLREMTVAKLEHGLDRVLFNPGVHRLRDPRSGIYNYTPYLRSIPDVDFFDYQALTPYTTSSQDSELVRVAQRENAQFCGSTSSLTAILSQAYFLLSAWKAPETSDFSPAFADQPKGFSQAAKLPASIALTPRSSSSAAPGSRPVYAIDQDKDAAGQAENSNYVLTSLGKSMEKWLTASPEDYSTYLRVVRGAKVDAEEQRRATEAASEQVAPEPEKEAYHYARTGKAFVMRSQLDCTDDRLPRKTFDLKTRAVASVRFDRANWSQAGGYQINHLNGLWESFERERYDMSRSAWLKYYFQARIGNMDGIFVAYHNAAKCFGFEYFPVEDLAERIFGTQEMAEQAFRLSVGLCERVLGRAVELYPGKALRMTFETPEVRSSGNTSPRGGQTAGTSEDVMSVWVQPKGADGTVVPDEITQLDVTVDRYLRGALVKGPISFKELARQESEGFGDAVQADVIAESMIQGKQSSPGVRPIDWTIEWMIDSRPQLKKEAIFERLDHAVSRLRSMSSLVLPEIEYVNDREVRLQTELSQSPAALLKYKQDKHSGVAAGMPRAPGQVELFALDDANDSIGVLASEEGTTDRHEDEGRDDAKGKARAAWTDPTQIVRALRLRSRQGAIQAQESDASDRLIRFRSTSEDRFDRSETCTSEKESP
ncbi:unnamed protein product [Parajaminaea phylloscopi]